MVYSVFIKCLVLLISSQIIFGFEETIGLECPVKCTCLKANARSQSSNKWYKLKCGGGEVKISSIDEIDFASFSNIKDIVNL